MSTPLSHEPPTKKPRVIPVAPVPAAPPAPTTPAPAPPAAKRKRPRERHNTERTRQKGADSKPRLDLVPARLFDVPQPLAIQSPAPNLLSFGKNDDGNASRLIAMYGPFLRYCHPIKKWLVWDGRRWAVDDTEQARRLARLVFVEFLRQCVEQCACAEDMEFAKGCLNSGAITSTLRMAQAEIFVKPAELDTHPDLLNFLNGTLNLRTGVLMAHDPALFITKLVHYNYRADAACPQFLAFLTRIASNHPGLITYLQKALGYSLTGHTIEKAVFLLHGSGDNGKSTLLSTFLKLLQEYSGLLQISTLMCREESNNSQADLADLRGARFVMTSETEEGQRLAEGKLKRITQGMGRIKATRKYEHPIEFEESHKLWIDANHLPAVRGIENAIWNRLHPIPFDIVIPKSEQDHELAAKLLAEAEGIIAWAVTGARLWYRHGLSKPPAVARANDKWRSNSDRLEVFIAERCQSGGEVPAGELYAAYQTWAVARGETVLNSKEFGVRVAERAGVARVRTRRRNVYRGIHLLRSGRVSSV
jgi:putative DNA primase/helicase